MINPYLLKPTYQKIQRMQKTYRPQVQTARRIFDCRKVFRRASEALAYAERVVVTWQRQYDLTAALSRADEQNDAMHEMDAQQVLTQGDSA